MTIQEYKKLEDVDLLEKAGVPTENKIYVTEDEKKDLEAKGIKVLSGYGYNNSAYYCEPVDISESDMQIIREYETLRNIRIIKNCAVYFTTVSIIGIVAYIVFLMATWFSY